MINSLLDIYFRLKQTMLGKLKLIVEPTFCRNCQISLLNLTFRRPQILEQNSNFNSGSQRQYTAIPLNHKEENLS